MTNKPIDMSHPSKTVENTRLKNNLFQIENLPNRKLISAEANLCNEIKSKTGLVLGRYFLSKVFVAGKKCISSGCPNTPEIYEARIVSAKDKEGREFGIISLNNKAREILIATNGMVAYCLLCQFDLMMDGINLTGVTEMDIDSLDKKIA